jgi:hypothetical protein
MFAVVHGPKPPEFPFETAVDDVIIQTLESSMGLSQCPITDRLLPHPNYYSKYSIHEVIQKELNYLPREHGEQDSVSYT